MNRCSLVIPVYGKAVVTKQCLDALLSARPVDGDPEIIVVDDASTDDTPRALAHYSDRVRVIRNERRAGFAASCNHGADRASREFLVFLNNDTIPTQGWLEALTRYADAHENAAAVGSRLLYPNDTIQHAGVVISQDGYPRHIYSGFPAEHPAPAQSRQFQAVTGAAMLVRSGAFRELGGFDEGYVNGLEDVDLCLRLGAAGYEVHHCAESVVYHLESVSLGQQRDVQNIRRYEERWISCVRRDDLDYYVADGMLVVEYEAFPRVALALDPMLGDAKVRGSGGETSRVLARQSREVAELLAEVVRLTVYIAEGQLRDDDVSDSRRRAPTRRRAAAERLGGGQRPVRETPATTEDLMVRAYELQAAVAAAGLSAPRSSSFSPGEMLRHRAMTARFRTAVGEIIPEDACVIVASRGDPQLIDLPVRRAVHFPCDESGAYAGYYPAGADEAVAMLRRAISITSAEYVAFPQSAAWWLDHYSLLRSYLEENGRKIHSDHTCVVYRLRVARADAPTLANSAAVDHERV